MTISSLTTAVKAGTMEKLMDPVTSDSELEEGEIANDEIEIISEIIRHPPNKIPHQSSTRETIPGKKLGSIRKLDCSADTQLIRGKLPGLSGGGNGGKMDSKRVSDLKPAQRAGSVKSSVSLKRKSPPRSVKRLGSSRSTSKSGNNSSSRSSRNRISSSSSRSNRERGSSTQAKKEDKPTGNSLTLTSAASRESKWKHSFELVTPGSVESVAADSASESDEEIKLRLEALNSVVVNAKPKEVTNSNGASSLCNSTPEPLITNGVQEEVEDEDEELLRAQLLIEVARKQTKELEVQMQPEPKDVKTDEAVPPVFERRIQATKPAPKPIHIPKADRLVIDLRNDSSDSSDEDDRVEVSITALLKSARQTVEEKITVIPHALSHLPRNQQEEYQRLKQEIVRRENRMKQGVSKGSTLAQSQSENLPKNDSTSETCVEQLLVQEPRADSTASEKLCSVPLISTTEQVATPPKPSLDLLVPQKASPAIPPLPFLPGSNAKENEQSETFEFNHSQGAPDSRLQTSTLAPRVADVSKGSSRSPVKPSDSNSLKLSALKQQLLHKRRDLATTKEALKSQLGLVDQNRLLWVKSSQEVTRLRAMLQAAEETERQLRTQLTNSQLQTQRLKTKMQSVERQVTVLHSGIGAHRTRRISTKLRPKITNQPGVISPASVILPPLTPLRVKPRVFAKALAKTNHLTYRRPTTAVVDSTISSPGALQLLKKQNVSEVLGGKKTLHGEQWLYGTLGDDWSDSNVVSNFPTWSPHGHASRFL